MNQKEFDLIMERFLDGAARVRAKKYERRTKSNNIHRELPARVISQMWKEETAIIKAA